MTVTAEFGPKYQFLFRPKRYKVLYGGRGAAKSWSIARALIIMSAQRKIRVLCAREIQNSIDDSVHKLLKDLIAAMGWQAFFETPQHAIRCTITGSEFGFEGIRHNVSKIRSWEGADYCWIEEAAKISRDSFDVLVPTIRKLGSEIWLSFNPDLDTDFVYEEFVQNDSPDSEVVMVNYWDNPWFADNPTLVAEMHKLKEKDYKRYLHVWEGHCKEIVDGAIYADELASARGENRIIAVPYDRSKPVQTFWDIGRADHTAIWFAQKVGFEYRVLRYYQNSGKHLDHYLQKMQAFGYTYGDVWLPHDAKAKTLGTKKSVEEQVKDKGYRARITPNLSIADGIEASRLLFPSLYFDKELCKDGIHCLKNARYEVTEKGKYSNKPLHDQYSHGADAFRYMGVAWKGYETQEDPESYVKKFLKNMGFEGVNRGSDSWMG